MASFEEVAAELAQVADVARKVIAAVREAGKAAQEAVDLVAAATRGAGHLEGEADQVVRCWTEVVAATGQLARVLAAACQAVDRLHRSFSGRAPATAESAQPATWAGRQRTQLPAHVTSGVYRDEDGHSDLVQSGGETNGEDREIARHLVAIGRVRPRTFPTVAQHVEMKVGWRMRARLV
ncbi:hypothetical protein ACVDFE_23885 [Lentzea chajnantorensis]